MDIKKIIAKKEVEIIGGNPKIFCYWDEDKIKHVDILSCVDRPYTGISSYGTIGLSDYDIGMVCNDKKLRIELLGACDKKYDYFVNMLCSTAFEIINRGSCDYGHVISNIPAEYFGVSEMQHIYLMNPFLWDGFDSMDFEDKTIAWLFIVPISNEENNYLLHNGWQALEEKFAEESIDIFNLNRKSVV